MAARRIGLHDGVGMDYLRRLEVSDYAGVNAVPTVCAGLVSDIPKPTALTWSVTAEQNSSALEPGLTKSRLPSTKPETEVTASLKAAALPELTRSLLNVQFVKVLLKEQAAVSATKINDLLASEDAHTKSQSLIARCFIRVAPLFLIQKVALAAD